MELGIFFDHLVEAARQKNLPLQRVLEHASAHNIRYVDIDGAFLMQNEHRVEDMLQKTGLYIGCVDGRFDLAHDQGMDEAEALIRFAAQRDIRHVLLIPGYAQPGEERGEIMERIAEYLRPLAHVAAGFHVQCSLEDYDDNRAPYGTWQELCWFLKRVEGLGVTFDTGNFAYFGQDAREALTQLLPFVRMAHCKDRARRSVAGEAGVQTPGGELLYPCAVGEGMIPIAELLKMLAKGGYHGGLTIEHFDSNRQYEAMAASADWLSMNI